MRKFITLMLLLCWGSAQASTVTIDFEEVTPVSSSSPISVTSKGYIFNTWTSNYSSGYDGFVADSNGIAVYQDALACGGFCGLQIIMEKDGGGVFAIASLEANFQYQTSFTGNVAGGGVADLSVAIGTGDWLNLVSLRYQNFSPQPLDPSLFLDDIVVTAVPIPAAVWLFASGLGLLGWFNKKSKRNAV